MCTYDASGSADADGTITSYEWTFGDGATLYQPAGTATATHSYRTGTFTVQLVVRDNGGASATASTTVQTVNNPPVPSFVTICDARSLHLRRIRLGGSGREGASILLVEVRRWLRPEWNRDPRAHLCGAGHVPNRPHGGR